MSTGHEKDLPKLRLTNVILPGQGTQKEFDVEVDRAQNRIHSISEAALKDEFPRRIIPTLCHPHIHLDKAFLLTSHRNDPKFPDYSDLAPKDGSFAEALSNTGKAKERYTPDDLLERGEQLINESIDAGVTSMRAFVEVDRVTELKCIQAGSILKAKHANSCHIQLCLFAQDPIITPEKSGPANRDMFIKALAQYSQDVDVIGSTPYVEANDESQQRNIDWTLKQALDNKKHVDFHLDYNLDSSSTPMIWYVIKALKKVEWVKGNPGKTVVIGHCTRMTLFSKEEMQKLAKQILDANLPVYFVGLPTSDLFMMGRPGNDEWGGKRPRGTMQVLELIRTFNLKACVGVNNVGNPFTPWGSLDPLKLASMGVGIYQAGTPKDAELLFECVSALAQEAIGLEALVVRSLEVGGNALFLIVDNGVWKSRAQPRARLTVADMVWDSPEVVNRQIVGSVGAFTIPGPG